MSKELSLNILEIAKKVQKLEAAGLPETYPADQVVMTGGGNVEDDLASAVPRTATGTTLAQLESALNLLTEEQLYNCRVVLNRLFSGTTYHYVLFYNNPNFMCGITWAGMSGTSVNTVTYVLKRSDLTVKYYDLRSGETDVTSQITGWMLYYSGTPIS